VALKRRLGENKIYAIIAVFILIVIVTTVIITSNNYTPAKIPFEFLSDDWFQDIEDTTSDSQILSSWSSLTYKNYNDSYPAYVTVTTRKTLFMMSEDELMDETIKTIKDASKQGIIVDGATKETGSRILSNGEHMTRYVVYNGFDNSNGVSEEIKIIGETWNCGISGISIICIGFAQTTDNMHDNPEVVTTHWAKIVRDEQGTFGTGEYMGQDGLIFNVDCH